MATYRVIKSTPLSTGHRQGDLVDGGRFKPPVLDALVKSGALCEASMPPLSELPGWATRAPRLAELGVLLVSDLVEADADTIKAIKAEFKYRTNAPIKKWQDEALEWLKPAAKKPVKR